MIKPKGSLLKLIHWDYIRRKAKDDKPFYLAYWQNLYDLIVKGMDKSTTSHGSPFAQNMITLDTYIGQVLDELEAQGISKNTLVVIMADNDPMKGIPDIHSGLYIKPAV